MHVNMLTPLSSVAVTAQFADKPTHGQSSLGLDHSRTGQLAKMFDTKFGKKKLICSKCEIYKCCRQVG